MRQRDLHGYTPFYSAIQMRAYSAALLMWTKLCDLQKGASGKMLGSELLTIRLISVEALSDLAFSGAGNDSVLFLLCYNDTVRIFLSTPYLFFTVLVFVDWRGTHQPRHFRMQNMRSRWILVLLHGMRFHLPPRP